MPVPYSTNLGSLDSQIPRGGMPDMPVYNFQTNGTNPIPNRRNSRNSNNSQQTQSPGSLVKSKTQTQTISSSVKTMKLHPDNHTYQTQYSDSLNPDGSINQTQLQSQSQTLQNLKQLQTSAVFDPASPTQAQAAFSFNNKGANMIFQDPNCPSNCHLKTIYQEAMATNSQSASVTVTVSDSPTATKCQTLINSNTIAQGTVTGTNNNLVDEQDQIQVQDDQSQNPNQNLINKIQSQKDHSESAELSADLLPQLNDSSSSLLIRLKSSNKANQKLTQDLQSLFERYLDTCADNEKLRSSQEKESSIFQDKIDQQSKLHEDEVRKVIKEKEKSVHRSNLLENELTALRRDHGVMSKKLRDIEKEKGLKEQLDQNIVQLVEKLEIGLNKNKLTSDLSGIDQQESSESQSNNQQQQQQSLISDVYPRPGTQTSKSLIQQAKVESKKFGQSSSAPASIVSGSASCSFSEGQQCQAQVQQVLGKTQSCSSTSSGKSISRIRNRSRDHHCDSSRTPPLSSKKNQLQSSQNAQQYQSQKKSNIQQLYGPRDNDSMMKHKLQASAHPISQLQLEATPEVHGQGHHANGEYQLLRQNEISPAIPHTINNGTTTVTVGTTDNLNLRIIFLLDCLRSRKLLTSWTGENALNKMIRDVEKLDDSENSNSITESDSEQTVDSDNDSEEFDEESQQCLLGGGGGAASDRKKSKKIASSTSSGKKSSSSTHVINSENQSRSRSKKSKGSSSKKQASKSNKGPNKSSKESSDNKISRKELQFRIEVLSQELLRRNEERELLCSQHQAAMAEISHLKNIIQEIRGNIRVFIRLRPLDVNNQNNNANNTQTVTPRSITSGVTSSTGATNNNNSSDVHRGIHVLSATGEIMSQKQQTQFLAGDSAAIQQTNVTPINSSKTLLTNIKIQQQTDTAQSLLGQQQLYHNTNKFNFTSSTPSRLTSLLLHANPLTMQLNNTSSTSSSSSNHLIAGGRPLKFSFDRVFPEQTSQPTLFEEVQPLLENTVLRGNGNHLAIFAYGQTSSGKSYTLDGTDSEPGILRRSVEDLLGRMCNNNSNRSLSQQQAVGQQQQQSGNVNHNDQQQQQQGQIQQGIQSQSQNVTTKLVISVVEIYNETVRDLLESSGNNLNYTDNNNNHVQNSNSNFSYTPRSRNSRSPRNPGPGTNRMYQNNRHSANVTPRSTSRGPTSTNQHLNPNSNYGANSSNTPRSHQNHMSNQFNSTNIDINPMNLEIRTREISSNLLDRSARGNLDRSARDHSANSSSQQGGPGYHQNQNFNHQLSLYGSKIFIEGLSSVSVSSWPEAERVLNKARKKRATGATNLNDQSSRSHCIFSLGVVQYTNQQGHTQSDVAAATGQQQKLLGVLHIVDLAGSERIKVSGADGQRLVESKHINKSLSALGDTLFALEARGNQQQSNLNHSTRDVSQCHNDNEFGPFMGASDSNSNYNNTSNGPGGSGHNSGRHYHIPFRNSKLSWLLSDVLSQQWSKVLFIATIHPGAGNLQESFSTLNFASRIANVEKGKLTSGGR